MSKNIVDGKLVEMSPSMITSFDPSTAFGCEQRAVFKYVFGLDDPPSGNQQLGTDLHALVEHRLRHGAAPAGEGDAFGLYLSGQAMIEQVASRKILAIETPLKTFSIADVKVKGFVDVVHEEGIIDWKTSSDIRRYGKTAADLAKDTQMVLYGKAEHPQLPFVKLAHGYFQTRGRKSTDFVEVEVTQDHLDAHIEKVIIPKVERMKVLAADPEQAVRDYKKCFNCTFRPRCPTPGAETVMGFFSKFNPSTTSATSTGAGSLLNDGSFATGGGSQAKKVDTSSLPPVTVSVVTPPDAPPSKPELAAEPVEGFSATPPPRKSMKIVDVENPESVELAAAAFKEKTIVGQLAEKYPEAAFKGESQTDRDARAALEYSQKLAEEANEVKQRLGSADDTHESTEGLERPETKKRGPGRPPGAKNKKTVMAPDNHGPAPAVLGPNESVDEKGYAYTPKASDLLRQFKAITVTKGATINVGNFNAVRFDVSVTSEEHTYEEVYAEVSRRLDAEAAKYEAEMARGQSTNAKGVVSK